MAACQVERLRLNARRKQAILNESERGSGLTANDACGGADDVCLLESGCAALRLKEGALVERIIEALEECEAVGMDLLCPSGARGCSCVVDMFFTGISAATSEE